MAVVLQCLALCPLCPLRSSAFPDRDLNRDSIRPVGAKQKARYRFRSRLSNNYAVFGGGTCGGRTHDKRIKSPLLYQLS